jgi:hypothetical protein
MPSLGSSSFTTLRRDVCCSQRPTAVSDCSITTSRSSHSLWMGVSLIPIPRSTRTTSSLLIATGLFGSGAISILRLALPIADRYTSYVAFMMSKIRSSNGLRCCLCSLVLVCSISRNGDISIPTWWTTSQQRTVAQRSLATTTKAATFVTMMSPLAVVVFTVAIFSA